MWGNAQKGGKDVAYPDFCLTPPLFIPIPFFNRAYGLMGAPPAQGIFFDSSPAHNLLTIVPITTGDEPGVGGGTVSGTYTDSSWHVTGANTLLLRGLPTTRLSSVTNQNMANVVGARVTPSQLKVLILTP